MRMKQLCRFLRSLASLHPAKAICGFTGPKYPIVLYNYQSGRGKEYPQEFLKGYKGYLQTDGYSVYHDLN